MYGYDNYEEREPGVTRQWIDYNSFANETGGISSLSFHDSCDMLWIGNDNGRITSYLHSYESTILKYSSCLAHTGPVLQLLPIPKHIVSISSEMTRIHTLGGLPVATLKPNLTDFKGETRELTCGTLFEPSGGLFRAETQNYLFLGASNNLGYAYDLNIPDSPLTIFEVESSAVCAHSSVTFLSVGCMDGKVRLLDPSLRSNTVLHAFDAHSGGVSSISVQGDGMTLISCGYQGRAINPYDPHSPMMYHLDPIVKIFDMRMLRQVAPLTLAIPPPNFVKFLPRPADSSLVNVLAVSSNGYIQTLSLTAAFEPLMDTLQIQYATMGSESDPMLSNPSDEVTVVNTSSNGHFIAVGSQAGVVSLHASVNPQDSIPIFQFNKESELLTIPPSAAPPPRPISIDSQEVATAYTVANHLLTGEECRQLGSSFLSTPKLLKSHFKSYSRLKVLPQLLSETTFQGSVGSIKNKTGFPPNSFLSHQARSQLYAKSDPRKLNQHPPTNSSDNTRDASNRTDSVGSTSSNEGSESVLRSKSSKNWFEGDCPHAVYAHFKSPRGKSRIQKFNYAAFNNTPFVGMENVSPHSWTNPLLQFLFAIPTIRQSALASQLSAFHHSMPISLLGELGFLFDMMISVRNSSIRHPTLVSKVVTPSNFQRALQVTPEAVAVGLFSPVQEESKMSSNFLGSPASTSALSPPHVSGVVDDLLTISRGVSDGVISQSSPQIPILAQEQNLNESKKLQNRIQLFTKFLLQQLKKENDSEMKFYQTNKTILGPGSQPSLVDAVAATFAFETVTTTTFLTSQTKGLTTHHTSYSIELVYSTHISQARSYISFSEILHETVCKTSQMRGWCAQSDSYEPCRQIKRIQFSKLQKILTLLCGDTFLNLPEGQKTSSEDRPEQKLWGNRNPHGGPWLPASLEVLFVPSTENPDSETGQLIISELLSEDTQKDIHSSSQRWLIYDGKATTMSSHPASKELLPTYPEKIIEASLTTCFSLFGVISGIRQKKNHSPHKSQPPSHPVLHMMTSQSPEHSEWTLFNDFSIMSCREVDARLFPDWRFPCVVFFLKEDQSKFWENDSLAHSFEQTPRIHVPPSILGLPSLSTVPCVPIQITHSDLTYLAFDAEFVSVEVEKAEMDARGQRIVHDEGRQVIARISLLEGSKFQSALPTDQNQQNQLKLLVDDYVLPVEPIVDYVSRFSGLHEEDLNPVLSRHAVVTNRTAYLKIKFYVDRGYIFIGHGLQKDFDIANIFVPPEQIRDTVELWRLPNQRKISLRFLASHVLGMEIQDDLHDSIEDSRSAYLLYKKYEEEKKKGDHHLHETLTELYAFGARTNWTIGLDRLSSSPIHQMKKSYPTSHQQMSVPPQGRHHHPSPNFPMAQHVQHHPQAVPVQYLHSNPDHSMMRTSSSLPLNAPLGYPPPQSLHPNLLSPSYPQYPR